MTSKLHAYSEIFYSIQGEGRYTGIPTGWLRFFACNLNCNGFGQKDPTDKSTHVLPYKEFDASSVEKIEDLPVWEFGCDSSYSWSAKFKHLQHREDAHTIAANITNSMITPSNPEGKFKHASSGLEQHMCFTGGEPLRPPAQAAVIEILREFKAVGNQPLFITFETNGTMELTPEFISFFNYEYSATEIFFSVSPKLFTVSGELSEKAIKPERVYDYYDKFYNSNGQLKPVVGSEDRQWEELENVIKQFRAAGVDWPVWVMPVSGTLEGQMATAGDVATMAFHRGYNVSARVHCYLWGNQIGT